MVVTCSSYYMYVQIYFLTAKLKLLPKEIIMCIINPTACDHSAPTGYVAPSSETKVPYSESPVGHPPHVDVFDTDFASSRLRNDVNEPSPSLENKQSSIPDVGLETDESTSQSSSATVNLENIAAERANFEIPAAEKVQREESKVQLNVPQHRVH